MSGTEAARVEVTGEANAVLPQRAERLAPQLQLVRKVEVDRSLYMDEARVAPHRGLPALAERLGRVYAAVARQLPSATLAAE